MSTEATAAVYGALVGGVLAIFGVLAGMFVARYLERRVVLRCVISGWELTFLEGGPLGDGEEAAFPGVDQAEYSFEVAIFNEDRLPTGLRGVCAALLRDDERELICDLEDPASLRKVEVLNLPPRQWVHARLRGRFEGEETRTLRRLRRADFVGYLPDGKVFRRKIVDRKDFRASRKRTTVRRKDYARSWWRRTLGG